MKKTINLVITFICFNLNSFSQKGTMDVRVEMLRLLSAEPYIKFEYGLSEKSAAEAALRLIYRPITISSIDTSGNTKEEKISRFGLQLDFAYNIYFKPDQGLDGGFVSPYLKYRNLSINYVDPVVQNRISLGVTFGKKTFFGTSKFFYTYQLGFGFALVNSVKDKNTGENSSLIGQAGVFNNFVNKIGSLDIPIHFCLGYRLASK